jgi:Tol biopolymer transport system component
LMLRGFTSSPRDEPVGWFRSPDRLMFQHSNEWVSGNSLQVLCKDTGLYQVDSDGFSPVLTGRALCAYILSGVRRIGISPDGLRIVQAEAPDAAVGGLHVVDLHGRGGVSLLPSAWGNAECPRWSPDGRWILFRGQKAGDSAEAYYLVASTGGEPRRIVGEAATRAESCPTWSPDSRRFALGLLPLSGYQYYDPGRIVVVNLQGEVTRVGEGYQPAWSPTGDWIAYVATGGASASDSANERLAWVSSIRIMTAVAAAGNGANRPDKALFSPGLGMHEGAPWGPLVWAPDGSRVAFTRSFPDGARIWSIGVDGGGLKEVVRP